MIIRPFQLDDAPAVASLWEYWFRSKTREPSPELVAYVRRLYGEHPSRDEEVAPLVAEDEATGRVLGFLGVMVTPVVVDGRRERLAGVFPSVVDPEAPTTVATFLLRRFLQGPQAFTLSDGGHVRFERIWERLGGRIDPLRSLRWVKVLRPAALGSGQLTRSAAVRSLLAPLASGADWVARRSAPERLRTGPRASELREEPLTPAALAAAVEELHAATRLRPAYDERHLGWLFGEMGRIRGQGTLHGRLLRTRGGALAGWYLYYRDPGGVSRVFALDGTERELPAVLDHLFAHADEGGAAAVIGRLEPKLRRPVEERGTFVYTGGSLLMVHSRDASLMDDALLGRLAFGRLEGENWYWWGILGGTRN